MDCAEIIEMIDAYALGATEPAEAKAIEEHVADCVRCWEELSSAQRTAALLALTNRIEQPPAQLGERIVAQAARERSLVPVETTQRPHSLWERLRLTWPATAGALGIASVAALAVSGVLAMQMQDLRDENNDLESQLQATALELDEQIVATDSQFDAARVMFTVLSDQEREQVPVSANSSRVSAEATYYWSSLKREGLLVCEDMPDLPPGKVYQLWFTHSGEAQALRPFLTTDGVCQVTMDLSFIQTPPTGIGVSVENSPGGAERPTGGWLLYAHFEN